MLPVIIVLLSSRPTQAESLLYNVGCLVRTIVRVDCAPSSTAPAPSQNQTTPSTPSQTSPAAPSNTPAPSPQPLPTTPEPIELEAETLPPLPAMDDPATLSARSLPAPANYSASVGPTIRTTTNPAAVLGVRQVSTIQATNEGWRILGMAWYWWLLIIAIIIVVQALIRRFFYKSFIAVVKR